MEKFEFELDEGTVQDAKSIFEALGLSLDFAVGIFLKQSVMRKGLPFALEIPGAEDGVESGNPLKAKPEAEPPEPILDSTEPKIENSAEIQTEVKTEPEIQDSGETQAENQPEIQSENSAEIQTEVKTEPEIQDSAEIRGGISAESERQIEDDEEVPTVAAIVAETKSAGHSDESAPKNTPDAESQDGADEEDADSDALADAPDIMFDAWNEKR